MLEKDPEALALHKLALYQRVLAPSKEHEELKADKAVTYAEFTNYWSKSEIKIQHFHASLEGET